MIIKVVNEKSDFLRFPFPIEDNLVTWIKVFSFTSNRKSSKASYMNRLRLIALATISVSATFAQSKKLTLTNRLAQERPAELVVLTREQVNRKVKITTDKPYFTITTSNGAPLVVQFDDLNGDGTWDEAAFLSSFAPKQKQVFFITASEQPAAVKALVQAHVRQSHKNADNTFALPVDTDTMPYNNQPTDFSKHKLPPYLTEGPAWENDKVGFRKYFDVRNSNDIWGKTTRRMVLEEVGTDPSVSYHHFNPEWGMDILKVGKALGAGALALQLPLNGKDSVFRFGTNVKQITYQKLADGPLRAIFRINYKGWQIAGLDPIDITEEISIWGGQYFFQNKVTLHHAPAGASLVTGTIDFYETGFHPLNARGRKGLYTYGAQSENQDKLGLAVLAPAKQVAATGPLIAGGIDHTFAVWLQPRNQTATYRYYTCWEKTDRAFAAENAFTQLLDQQAAFWENPIRVK